MSKELCYTVGVTLHIFADNEDDMDEKLHRLWGLYPDVLVADWELVEVYDPDTERVIA